MSNNSSVEAGGQEYLVAARAAGADGARDMQEVVSRVKKLTGAKILQSSGTGPERLVVRMSAQQADGLKAAFGGRIIVEPNAELRF